MIICYMTIDILERLEAALLVGIRHWIWNKAKILIYVLRKARRVEETIPAVVYLIERAFLHLEHVLALTAVLRHEINQSCTFAQVFLCHFVLLLSFEFQATQTFLQEGENWLDGSRQRWDTSITWRLSKKSVTSASDVAMDTSTRCPLSFRRLKRSCKRVRTGWTEAARDALKACERSESRLASLMHEILLIWSSMLSVILVLSSATCCNPMFSSEFTRSARFAQLPIGAVLAVTNRSRYSKRN